MKDPFLKKIVHTRLSAVDYFSKKAPSKMFDRILKALSGIFNSPSATNSLHTNPEILFFNPFVPNALFLYPLKTSESRKVF